MMRTKIIDLPQPDIRPHSESGKKRYKLNENYRFVLNIDGEKHTFQISKGMTYDGASIPRFIMAIIGLERNGIHRAGALLHDYLYKRMGRIMDENAVSFIFNRKDIDRLFLKGIEFHGIKSWHGRLSYLAVRAFGWLKVDF